jgi:hypothetical protein
MLTGMQWLRRNPVAAFLPLQALLYFWNLGLLSPWMDEAGTLMAVRGTLRDVIQFAAQDVHPPVFYLLLYAWQRLPLGLDWAVQARALPVVFALLATVAADRWWGSRLRERGRICFLALWTLSPGLLLYSRMCRSYSLQLLAATIAGAYILRFAETRERALDRRTAACLIASLTAALYTHYVPGLALLGAANLVLLGKRRLRDALLVDGLVGLAYLPWIWKMATSLGTWGSHAAPYAITGATWLEIPLKLAYWAISLVIGEAAPDAVLVLGCLLLPLIGYLVFSGVRSRPAMGRVAAAAAIIGFIGVARWVSYPFVPARMLFLLPFFLALLAEGVHTHRHAGAVAVAGMLALSCCGIWCYFHKTGFRNKQYPMPIAEIAAQIQRNSSAADSVILVDSTNSDPPAMQYALGSRPVLISGTAQVQNLLADSRVRTIWFLRNGHDVSPGKRNERIEAQLREELRVTVHPYQRFSPLETGLMRAIGIAKPPEYFHYLLEFRR